MAAVVTQVNSANLKIVYNVANAAFIQEDPMAVLTAKHAMIGLTHISNTGLDVWGHDPIGTGNIDFDALGKAVELTILRPPTVVCNFRYTYPSDSFSNCLTLRS